MAKEVKNWHHLKLQQLFIVLHFRFAQTEAGERKEDLAPSEQHATSEEHPGEQLQEPKVYWRLSKIQLFFFFVKTVLCVRKRGFSGAWQISCRVDKWDGQRSKWNRGSEASQAGNKKHTDWTCQSAEVNARWRRTRVAGRERKWDSVKVCQGQFAVKGPLHLAAFTEMMHGAELSLDGKQKGAVMHRMVKSQTNKLMVEIHKLNTDYDLTLNTLTLIIQNISEEM